MKKHIAYISLIFTLFIFSINLNALNKEKSTSKKTSNSQELSNNKELHKFTLPQLPYSIDALEPYISKSTIEYHYGKHFKAYIDNLNKLIIGTPFENNDLETIVKTSDGSIFNNAGQALNHEIYFSTFSPNAKKIPSGKLLKSIEEQWSTFDNFKKEFSSKANTIFGSGWAWLAKDKNGKLFILTESNAGNPVTSGLIPLLGIDVWEHSYYLDYQNRRADHINQLWNIIDWSQIEKRY